MGIQLTSPDVYEMAVDESSCREGSMSSHDGLTPPDAFEREERKSSRDVLRIKNETPSDHGSKLVWEEKLRELERDYQLLTVERDSL